MRCASRVTWTLSSHPTPPHETMIYVVKNAQKHAVPMGKAHKKVRVYRSTEPPTNITGKPHDLNGKNYGFRLRFSHWKPIHWTWQYNRGIWSMYSCIPSLVHIEDLLSMVPNMYVDPLTFYHFLLEVVQQRRGMLKFGDLTNKNRIQLTIVENQGWV